MLRAQLVVEKPDDYYGPVVCFDCKQDIEGYVFIQLAIDKNALVIEQMCRCSKCWYSFKSILDKFNITVQIVPPETVLETLEEIRKCIAHLRKISEKVVGTHTKIQPYGHDTNVMTS